MADYDNVVRQPLLEHAPNGQEEDGEEIVNWAVISLVHIVSNKGPCRGRRHLLNL